MPDDNQTPAVQPDAAQAFDIKDLERRLKDAGLEQVEGLARAVVVATFEWAEASVKASASKYDDLVLGLTGPLRTFLLAKIDAISDKA